MRLRGLDAHLVQRPVVAKMALRVADQYGLERFRTAGWSGGGPFALGTAAIAGERVEGVGVIAGAAPFQPVSGALDVLSDSTGPPSDCSPSVRFYSGVAPRTVWQEARSMDHWFEENLPDARLTMRGGEGHLQPFAHLAEMLADLMAV